MRTQTEILDMIQKIRKSKADPSMVQQKTLFHKLEWKNAVQFIEPPARTQANRQKFESMNSMDAARLREELVERIDQLFMFLADNDLVKIHIHLQMILVYLWLIGPEKQDLFRWLHERLGWPNMNWRKVGRHLADELGINWKILEMRYV